MDAKFNENSLEDDIRKTGYFKTILIVAIIGGFLGIDAYFINASYNRTFQAVDEAQINKIQAIANTIAVQLDATIYNGDPEYTHPEGRYYR